MTAPFAEPSGRKGIAPRATGLSGAVGLRYRQPMTVNPLDFKAHLNAAAQAISKRRSGERSALKLAAAGARLLDDRGFRDLAVEDVAGAARLAKGTFYIYFESKDVFLGDLCRRYVAFEFATLPDNLMRDSLFAATRRVVAWYEGAFVANAGVIRCLVQMGSSNAPMRALWHERNRAIVERLLDLSRGRLDRDQDPTLLRLAVRTAGGMLDQSLFNRFDVAIGTGADEAVDPETLLQLHALLIHRALYGADPPEPEVRAAGPWLELPRL